MLSSRLVSVACSKNFPTRIGDQRPCERCGDKKPCRDGKRKKAKYLEGTEDKDLIPVQEKEQEEQDRQRALNRFGAGFFPDPGFPMPRSAATYSLAHPQPAPPGFPMFAPNEQHLQTATQPYLTQMMPNAQQRTFNYNQQQGPMDNFNPTLQPATRVPSEQLSGSFGEAYPDLDFEEMGFGNRFGALEFNMLNQMSSAVAATPPGDGISGFENSDNINFGMLPADSGSSPASAQQWRLAQPGSSQGAIAYNFGGQDQDPFDGFVKQKEPTGGFPAGTLPGQSSYPSPISGPKSGPSPQGMMAGFEGNPATTEAYTNMLPSRQTEGLLEAAQLHRQQPDSAISASTIPSTTPSTIPAPSLSTQNIFTRRSRNPSTVYNTVMEPYSYTKAFHDLMALIRKRFSQRNTARIARALASIRPSFISLLTRLDDDDRVFMEKCLQRTLLEYEDNLSLTGTPTILCRRTGEVVAVGEGFCILTGWRKAILLGREPNLNVNRKGELTNLTDTGASTSRSINTSKVFDGFAPEDSQPKPVSIVHLFDDESVCEFFDDYAHLAFGDSRGSVTTPCMLLKYKTAVDRGLDKTLDNEVETGPKWQRDSGQPGRADEDDKVDCMLCWSVKRDVFDIPMLIVMNVLPRL